MTTLELPEMTKFWSGHRIQQSIPMWLHDSSADFYFYACSYMSTDIHVHTKPQISCNVIDLMHNEDTWYHYV